MKRKRVLDPASKDAVSSQTHSLRWRLIALLIAMSGVGSLSLNLLVPAIPGLVAKFAADPASVQLTVSLYLLGLSLAQLVFGPLSDRFGRRPVVLAGLALAACFGNDRSSHIPTVHARITVPASFTNTLLFSHIMRTTERQCGTR